MRPRWKSDEVFAKFVVGYLATGAALIDDDFNSAYEYCWLKLDWEEKAERVKSLARHAEQYRADPLFVPMPLKFLRTEWQRAVRPAAKNSAPEPAPVKYYSMAEEKQRRKREQDERERNAKAAG